MTNIFLYKKKDIPDPNDMLRRLGWWWWHWQPVMEKKTTNESLLTRWWLWELVWLKKTTNES
jgi:hypothetical protein